MHGRLRIAIVGYGTAGQASALFLSAQGHAISIFEQAPEPGPVGAGFLLQPTGLGVLSRLGLDQQALSQGQRIERLFGCNVAGRIVMDMRYADHRADCFGLGLTRGSLFTLMRDAMDSSCAIHAGVRIDGMDAQTHHVVDSHGQRFGPFDLIVLADGAHSRSRAALLQKVQRETLYPWGAMWCLLPAENWPFKDVLQQRYSGVREMIGVLPVGHRVDRDGRWVTFYFSLPGISVDGFDDAALARLRERTMAIWPEAMSLLEGIDASTQLHRARYRDVVLRYPAAGRVVAIGDAAHAMSPQLGQGVNMALLDATSLADALASNDTIEAALRDHAEQRRRHLAVYQRLSRWLTPLFQSEHDWLASLRDVTFAPLSKLPLARGQMLKILTGTKMAWWR